MEGRQGKIEKIPRMHQGQIQGDFWLVVGHILSHAFVLCKYFPKLLCKASVAYMLTDKMCDDLLAKSVMLYLPEGDEILKNILLRPEAVYQDYAVTGCQG